MNDNMFDYFSITDRVDMFSRTYDINPINSTYIESLCVFTKKKEQNPMTNKDRKRAEFVSKKIRNKK